MLGKGHDGLYKAPATEERRSERLRRERDQIKFINLRFERQQVEGRWKGRRRQGVS